MPASDGRSMSWTSSSSPNARRSSARCGASATRGARRKARHQRRWNTLRRPERNRSSGVAAPPAPPKRHRTTSGNNTQERNSQTPPFAASAGAISICCDSTKAASESKAAACCWLAGLGYPAASARPSKSPRSLFSAAVVARVPPVGVYSQAGCSGAAESASERTEADRARLASWTEMWCGNSGKRITFSSRTVLTAPGDRY